MAKERYEEELSILDAVDNLSSMAEIDVESIAKKRGRLSTQWIDPQDHEKTYSRIKNSFKAVHSYLKQMHSENQNQLQDRDTQKGIHAIMSLAGEAAEKIDKCKSLLGKVAKKEKVTELKEFKDLQEFYTKKIMQRFKEVLEEEEAWKEEWELGETDLRDIERIGLKDLETVKKDRSYELFYIRKEDGKPYFNRNLLRHIKLVSDFDDIIASIDEEDPLLKIKILHDKDAQETATELLDMAAPYMKAFYSHAMKFRSESMVTLLNKTVMALMLASNRRNLMQHVVGKSCDQYFHDFQIYLRELTESTDYQHFISHPPEKGERLSRSVLDLVQGLCFGLYTHMGDKSDTVAFIEQFTQRSHTKKEKGLYSFWESLLRNHEAIKELLSRHPSGPLFKTLDIFADMDEAFDPILQGNLPSKLFTLQVNAHPIDCLRLPCPTRQSVIDKAEVIEEFKNFIRFMDREKSDESLLVINYQDRTSWEEKARCDVIEKLPQKAEFSSRILVVTLPKNTDFYFQTDDYLKMDEAELFLGSLEDQILSAEECGFFFSSPKIKKEIQSFSRALIPAIHNLFFDGKKTLSRTNRLDFIELYYDFLTLKLLELIHPTKLLFSCKDAVDTTAAASLGMFAILKRISGSKTWEETEKERILWMCFAPALLIRERVIDMQRLSRTISSIALFLSTLEEPREADLAAFQKLFHVPIVP